MLRIARILLLPGEIKSFPVHTCIHWNKELGMHMTKINWKQTLASDPNVGYGIEIRLNRKNRSKLIASSF